MRRTLISSLLGLFASSLVVGCGNSGPVTAPPSGVTTEAPKLDMPSKGPRATKIEKKLSTP